METWENPLNSIEDRLAICAGAVEFERKVVANLREQIAAANGRIEAAERHAEENARDGERYLNALVDIRDNTFGGYAFDVASRALIAGYEEGK